MVKIYGEGGTRTQNIQLDTDPKTRQKNIQLLYNNDKNFYNF